MRDEEPVEVAANPPSAPNSLLSRPFRDAMRRFATTVSIITCAHGGSRFGMSATAVTSLSVDPPSLLVCVNKSAATHRVMSRGGRFCVNVLRSVHVSLSHAFSGRLKGEDRFTLGHWGQTEDGLPFLEDAQANLFCDIVRVVDYETHTILSPGSIRPGRRRTLIRCFIRTANMPSHYRSPTTTRRKLEAYCRRLRKPDGSR